MKRTYIAHILLAVFAAIFVYSAYRLITIQLQYRKSREIYDSLTQFVRLPESTEDYFLWPEVDFQSLRAINPDIVAWIYLPGSPLNYPVVQGDDNQYYLTHTVEHTVNSSGSLFLDYRNSSDFSDYHSIIYGHNMNSGTMFSLLKRYLEQDFYEDNAALLLLTPDADYRLEIFSVYMADVDDAAWELDFTAESYAGWLAETQNRSQVETRRMPDASAHSLTLSTCSNGRDEERVVVVGELVPRVKGESQDER